MKACQGLTSLPNTKLINCDKFSWLRPEESGTNRLEFQPLVTRIAAAVSQPDIHLVSSHMHRLQTGFVRPVIPQQISFDFNPQNLHSWRIAHKILIIPFFFSFGENSEWLKIFWGFVSVELNFSRCLETCTSNQSRLCLPEASWDSRFSATRARRSASRTGGCQAHIPLCYAKCRMPGEGSTERGSRKPPESPSFLEMKQTCVSIQQETVKM